eukprot:scpid6568/ scgid11698/ 
MPAANSVNGGVGGSTRSSTAPERHGPPCLDRELPREPIGGDFQHGRNAVSQGIILPISIRLHAHSAWWYMLTMATECSPDQKYRPGCEEIGRRPQSHLGSSHSMSRAPVCSDSE